MEATEIIRRFLFSYHGNESLSCFPFLVYFTLFSTPLLKFFTLDNYRSRYQRPSRME